MYICQICKKTPATIHLTDIHNNVKKEVHLCEKCATEKGFNFQTTANLPHLLGLAAKKAQNLQTGIKFKPVSTPSPAPAEDLQCPQCGLCWSQFSERGRLGCANDYKAFDAQLRQLISGQIAPHVKNRDKMHFGKTPGPRREEDETVVAIRSLEKRLRQAVAEENYEAAAGMKNELDALRKKAAEIGNASPANENA